MPKSTKNVTLPFSRNPVKMFLVCTILAGTGLLIAFLLSRGGLIEHYFAWDPYDTSMDYYNSIAYTLGGVPYSRFNTLYPPLANIIFFLLLHLVPPQISSRWVTSADSILMSLQPYDPRMQQSTLLFFLLFVVIVCSLFCFLIMSILTEKKKGETYAIALACILSFGFTWAIERGNIIILAFVLALYFVAFHNSPHATVRETAYIALALAAGLKIYPAFLGVLLLHDKRWAASQRLVLYGLAAFILPCFLLKDGLNSIVLFFDVLSKFGSKTFGLKVMGCGIKDMCYSLISLVAYIKGIDVKNLYPWLEVGQLIAYLLCLALLSAGLFIKTNHWKRLLLIVLAMICIQTAPYYMLIYILIPFVYFLKEEEKLNRHNILYFLLLLALVVQVPFFDNDRPLKWKALQVQTCTLSLLILVLWDVIIPRSNRIKHAAGIIIKE